MPTLTELQRGNPFRPLREDATFQSEELITDSRATLSPSQLVDRKLQARVLPDFNRQKSDIVRPRAK
ncbi:hypothetical protein ETAA8_34390 [Anatilimnocola aggregata]|uniref:Uncharacterized protein n=1 Tax=Anatilimnocola aggregata TaxID=2528021 RepID=A0A517YDR8_9BACT|nr:hypothetical protein [Anatilimnocola aggregata]QDU28339.1 hypothetical protein ETAA8_34390 [Anatilimnocola aggregata]